MDQLVIIFQWCIISSGPVVKYFLSSLKSIQFLSRYPMLVHSINFHS